MEGIQLERLLRIHEELLFDPLVNCTRLRKLLECSRKTLVRDIAFMRDRLNLPITYDPSIKAYRYTHPIIEFPGVTAEANARISELKEACCARDRYIAWLTRSLSESRSFSGCNKLAPGWVEYGRQLRKQVDPKGEIPEFLRAEIQPFESVLIVSK